MVGVPDRTPPDVNVIGPPVPAGTVPENVGGGVPVAVTVKVPGVPTVKVVVAALVNAGGTGVANGVNELLTPAGPGPPVLEATTEHVSAVPIVRLLMVRVVAPAGPPSVPATGVQVIA